MPEPRFETSLTFILKWEGSQFTNDPDDHGGATRYGVIQREYDDYRHRNGLANRSVEFIDMSEVRDLYRHEYWDAVQGDHLPVPLDLVTFDSGILMGVRRAIRFLQQSLGVSIDGAIGPETREALAHADPQAVAKRFTDLREARLHAIVEHDHTQQKFLKGWLNRLNDLRQTIAQPDPHLQIADAEIDQANPLPAGSAVGRTNDLPGEFPPVQEKG